MIDGLAHVCIAASDLKQADRFYCETLGFRRRFDFLRNGNLTGFYLEIKPGSYVEVFQQSEIIATDKAPIRHLCFETRDIDAVGKKLSAMGYPVTEKKLGADKSFQIWTQDSSGVKIEFHQYTENSSQKTGAPCILS